jgi:hypothetical protein
MAHLAAINNEIDTLVRQFGTRGFTPRDARSHDNYFLADNLGLILRTNTNIFILLPSEMKWFDMNPPALGAEHNWGPRAARGDNPDRYGDMLHVVLPLDLKV